MRHQRCVWPSLQERLVSARQRWQRRYARPLDLSLRLNVRETSLDSMRSPESQLSSVIAERLYWMTLTISVRRSGIRFSRSAISHFHSSSSLLIQNRSSGRSEDRRYVFTSIHQPKFRSGNFWRSNEIGSDRITQIRISITSHLSRSRGDQQH